MGRNLVVLLGLASILAACDPSGATNTQGLELWASPNRTITASAGHELALKIQTIGPGSYDSIPAISSTALSFVASEMIGTPPAGPTRRFRFRVVGPGTAVVVFRFNQIIPGWPDRTLQDTVVVR
jgi:hypothetical protein